MPRFVVLEHSFPEGDARQRHWDLLLESERRLVSWSLVSPPAPDCAIEARRLPDHRLRYLDYEGSISGQRGSVTRWDRGRYTAREQTERRWEIEIAGERLEGQVLLEQAGEAQCWRFVWTES